MDAASDHPSHEFPRVWGHSKCQGYNCEHAAAFWCQMCDKRICGNQCLCGNRECLGCDCGNNGENWWRPRSHQVFMHRPLRSLGPFLPPAPPVDWMPWFVAVREEDNLEREYAATRNRLQSIQRFCERLASSEDQPPLYRSRELGPILRDIQWLEVQVIEAMRRHLGISEPLAP